MVPEGETGEAEALQLMCTIMDIVSEVHDTHHPLGSHLYYEDQLEAAKSAAQGFCQGRLAIWLAYLESVVAARGGKWLLGDAITYPDLALFQLLKGLEYSFPKAFGELMPKYPLIQEIGVAVEARDGVAKYLKSADRIPFNKDGIFRQYPELDFSSTKPAE